MLETSARLLRLLSLLQTHRDWSGPDLAERLGVTTRTVRNDVERLRALGYPVHATPGVSGGYRLGAGAQLPPLLLDDEEAVAVAVGLRTAASGTVAGIEETSVRALAKLEQILPGRLRRRVNAVQAYTVPVPGRGPTVDADLLTTLATTCRDAQRLRFDYRSHDGAATRREVEPHRLVHLRGRWYLLAWDLGRDDWRTFRADRIEPKIPAGPRFTPREPPEEGVGEFVERGAAQAPWRFRARVRVHAPRDVVAARVPVLAGQLEAIDDNSCLLTAGSDNPHQLLVWLGMLDVDFEIVDSPALADAVTTLIARYHRALKREQGSFTSEEPGSTDVVCRWIQVVVVDLVLVGGRAG
ncbi:helix-turn-helix transcriptional regulator, partial [Amycolatopsis suaedae]